MQESTMGGKNQSVMSESVGQVAQDLDQICQLFDKCRVDKVLVLKSATHIDSLQNSNTDKHQQPMKFNLRSALEE